MMSDYFTFSSDGPISSDSGAYIVNWPALVPSDFSLTDAEFLRACGIEAD